MDFKASTIILALLVVACNGCEMHRRMEEARRQREARLRAAAERRLQQAQDQAYEDVRQSLYGSSNGGGSDYVRRTSYLPSGSKFCPGTNTYYCSEEATCIPNEDGTWSCQYQSVTSYRPTVTRTRYGDSQSRTVPLSSNYRQRSRYRPYQPRTNYGSVHRTYRRYSCSSGLERVNITERTFKCVDIDECDTEANQCSQTCKNTYGSFYCTCESGYKREGATECIDRDECEESSRACATSSTCINTEGSYECECNAGYRRSEVNARICNEINECQEDDPCDESEICFNTFGSYQCDEPFECPEGYRRANATGSSKQDCTREATAEETDDPESPDFISYKKIGVEARERADYTNRLASLTFSGGNSAYNHNFYVRVLEGRDYFTHRRRNRYGYNSDTLQLDIYNIRPLEAGVPKPYTLLITNRMIPKQQRRTFSRYRYGGEYGRYYGSRPRSTTVTTKRKVVMEMVPMSHDMVQEDDDIDYY